MTEASDTTILAFGDYELDFGRNELRRQGRPVELQATPLRVLLYLAEHRDRAVPGDELLDHVWPDALVTDTSLSRALTQVRHAVGDDGVAQRVIRTQKGLGYRFVAEVDVLQAALDHAPSVRRRWQLAFAAGTLAALAVAWFASTRPPSPLPSGPIRSLAVLPLGNLSEDPEQEYIVEGMHVTLIGTLGRLPGFDVTSRFSSVHVAALDLSIQEIAQKLNVGGIIEGEVMRAGDRVRITLRLIDGRTDTQLWTEQYDRDLSDVLRMHGEVARAVADQVQLELAPEELAAMTPSRSVERRAMDAYLRALQLRESWGLVASWGPAAVEQLERAVELDPGFAEAWAELAVTYAWMRSSGSLDGRTSAPILSIREAAERALSFDDRLGGAHAVLADIQLAPEWDFPGARRAFEQGFQLSPSDPIVLNNYAWYLLVVGRTDEALGVMERHLRVAPFDYFWRSVRPRNFYLAGQYERALQEIEAMKDLDPHYIDFIARRIYRMLGRFDESHRAALAWYERCGEPCDWQREAIEQGWGESGWQGSQLAWAEAAADRDGVSSFIIALAYLDAGDTDEAFEWLERGYRERDYLMLLMKAPYMDPVRNDPRYQDLVRRMGFPQS